MSMNAVSNVAGGGEPPYDMDMDRRLTVLETRFDAILPTLATKSDLEALRAEVRVGFEKLRGEFSTAIEKQRGEFSIEMEKQRGEFSTEMEKLRIEMEKLRADLFKALNDHMRWMIGMVVSLFIGSLALNVAMFNSINSRMSGSQTSTSAVQPGSVTVPPPISPPQANRKEGQR